MKATFVSTSGAKKAVVIKRSKERGLDINTESLELYEEQSIDAGKVAFSKAMYAYSILKKPVFVDDRGLRITALNGFPGALLKFAINTIGAEGLVRLMDGQKNRGAVFETAVAFMSPELKKPLVFKSFEKGKILKEVRGGKLRGWTDVIRIFSPPTHKNRALSELSDEEWEDYQEENAKKDHLEKFFSWIEKNGK